MADVTYNNKPQRRIPINRNNMFYPEECFELDVEMGKAYVDTDLNQTLILFQVDLSKTNSDSLYGETTTDGVAFKTPVEIHCIYEVEDAELSSYDKSKNLGTYVKPGNLKFGVYQATLDELGAEIKIGDYVGVIVDEDHIVYYVVNNDGRNNYDNSHMLYGYKPAYRNCEASYVDNAEFNGK